VIKRRFETLGDLEKLFHMFLNNIDYEILVQSKMRFEKVSNFIQIIKVYGIEKTYNLI
jgi:hypothetical protein